MGNDARIAGRAVARQQGRRPRSDSVDIRQRIMDVSIDLFAQQGFTATSIRQIADEVGVNSAMVHYYFGTKKALLHETLEQALEPLVEVMAVMKRQGKAPLRNIVSAIFGVFKKKPLLPILLTREVFLPGGVIKQHFMEHFAPRLGGALPLLLAKEQKEGRIRSGTDTRLLTQTLLGLCAFPFISQSMAEPVLGISYSEKGMQELEQNIVKQLERGYLS